LTIIKAGRKRNEGMPLFVIKMISEIFEKEGLKLKNSSVLILGISYKPNVKDIQLSPAEIVIKELQIKRVNVKIFDPYFISEEIFGIQTEDNFENVLTKVDAIILLTAHKEFLNIDLSVLKSKMKNPIVIDTRGIINIHTAEKIGITLRSLGRKL